MNRLTLALFLLLLALYASTAFYAQPSLEVVKNDYSDGKTWSSS